jgi:excisionase family DNA binding protein
MSKTADDYISVTDAAQTSGLSRATIFRLISDDKLKTFKKLGDRRTLVSKAAVKKLMGPKEKK